MSTTKERFEKIGAQYDAIYDRFVEFHLSPLGREHKGCLGDFIHETNGLAGKLGRALLNVETLPSRGERNILWSHEHNLLSHMGVMELILKLSKGK